MPLPKNILVPTDFSECATAALDYAVELAAKLDARVHVVNAVGVEIIGTEYGMSLTPDLVNMVYASNQRELDKIIAERASKVPFGPALLETGDPRQVIDEAVTKVHADLIVMGTHGRRGFRRLFLGSVAESVARTAACPVLLVRGTAS
jgi:nucleotide-binding universal stress UspA family protein